MGRDREKTGGFIRYQEGWRRGSEYRLMREDFLNDVDHIEGFRAGLSAYYESRRIAVEYIADAYAKDIAAKLAPSPTPPAEEATK